MKNAEYVAKLRKEKAALEASGRGGVVYRQEQTLINQRLSRLEVRCTYCGYTYPDACGFYGCPNCNGEGF